MRNIDISVKELKDNPFLWVRVNDPEADMDQVRVIAESIQKELSASGKRAGIIITEGGYDLDSIDHQDLLRLIPEEKMSEFGWYSEKSILSLLVAIGKPIEVPKSVDEYVGEKFDQMTPVWFVDSQGKRFVGIQWKGDRPEEESPGPISIIKSKRGDNEADKSRKADYQERY